MRLDGKSGSFNLSTGVLCVLGKFMVFSSGACPPCSRVLIEAGDCIGVLLGGGAVIKDQPGTDRTIFNHIRSEIFAEQTLSSRLPSFDQHILFAGGKVEAIWELNRTHRDGKEDDSWIRIPT